MFANLNKPPKLMKKFSIASVYAITLLMCIVQLHAQQLLPASSRQHGSLIIESPWVRATLGGATTAAGYLSIDNKGGEDRLLRISTSKSQRAEIHEMSIVDDIMRMRELPQGLVIPRQTRIELKSGGYHFMFIQITEPFKIGDKIRVTLYFEKAGVIDLTFDVRQGKESEQEHKH
jgi:periplasmic copper chaperone A